MIGSPRHAAIDARESPDRRTPSRDRRSVHRQAKSGCSQRRQRRRDLDPVGPAVRAAIQIGGLIAGAEKTAEHRVRDREDVAAHVRVQCQGSARFPGNVTAFQVTPASVVFRSVLATSQTMLEFFASTANW